MPEVGRFTGRHVLAELHGIDPGLLDDAARLGELLRAAVTEAGVPGVAARARVRNSGSSVARRSRRGWT